MMDASRNLAPEDMMTFSISWAVAGAMALHSAKRRSVCPVSVTASATCRQISGTAPETVMDMIRSDCATISAKLGTSSIPAVSDNTRVRSLRPVRQVTTRSSCSRRVCPTA